MISFELSILMNLLFLGGGGVGKSYLITTVAKWVEKILLNPGPISHKVLLLAFTGFAASLIGKSYLSFFL